MKQHNIVFQPSGLSGVIQEGTTLREAAYILNEGIESVCGGKGSCGKCKIRVLEGYEYGVNSSLSHLSPTTDKEQQFAQSFGLGSNERLACQAQISGEVAVFVPEESRTSRQIILKTAGDRVIQIVPSIRKYYLDTPPIEPNSTTLNPEILLQHIRKRFGLQDLTIDPQVSMTLVDTPWPKDQGLTITVWNKTEFISIQTGHIQKSYGLAIDIGTTTIGSYLCDLDSGEVIATEAMMNPQIQFGEDIMTRINYAKETADGLSILNKSIISTLNELIRILTSKVNLIPDDILEAVVVGNTVMHHIFLGLDIVPLGLFPFTPSLDNSLNSKARDIGLEILPSANVFTLPIEAGFVGADNVGVLIAEEPHNQDDNLLIIDIGTNGEIVLGNRQRLLSASCATGPAFEGANIKFGMRAAPGAIAKVRVDPQTFDVSFVVIGGQSSNTEMPSSVGHARGICGSGVIDAVAELLGAGLIKTNGSFDKTLNTPRLRLDGDDKPEFVIAWAEETAIEQDITITQKDIRAIQLAKAALYSGALLMMKRLGIERPDKVILAGAFGTVIDRSRALAIGMFPECELENILAVGNAAGDGARIALLNKDKRQEADKIAREVEYIELTAEPGFEEAFINATHFPLQ